MSEEARLQHRYSGSLTSTSTATNDAALPGTVGSISVLATPVNTTTSEEIPGSTSTVEITSNTTMAQSSTSRRTVTWTEEVVDNEHLNRKKSKICCIYEKPHKPGECHPEDADNSSDDEDGPSSGGGAGRPNAYERAKRYPPSRTSG